MFQGEYDLPCKHQRKSCQSRASFPGWVHVVQAGKQGSGRPSHYIGHAVNQNGNPMKRGSFFQCHPHFLSHSD